MNGLSFSDQLADIDFARVSKWLADSYWSPGIGRNMVEQGASNSTVCVGAFIDGQQVAFGRVISDTTRFAYVADVVVAEAWRRRGIATQLMQYLLQHPRLAAVQNWYLITMDAQGVYAPLGFARYDPPNRTIMSLHR